MKGTPGSTTQTHTMKQRHSCALAQKKIKHDCGTGMKNEKQQRYSSSWFPIFFIIEVISDNSSSLRFFKSIDWSENGSESCRRIGPSIHASQCAAYCFIGQRDSPVAFIVSIKGADQSIAPVDLKI